MLNKNILRDVFTCKRSIGVVLISDFVQALMMVLAALIMAYLANAMLFSKLDQTAVPLLVLLFFCLVVKAVLAYRNRLQVEDISLSIQTKLRVQLLARLAKAKGASSLSEGQWVAVITKGVDKLDVYINNFLPQLGILIVTPITLLIFAFAMDWLSGVIFLVTAPLIPGFMILIGKLAKGENEKQWATFQKLSTFMVDFLPGILVLKAYNQAETQLRNLQQQGDRFSATTLKVLRIAFLSAFMLELISTLSIALIAVNIGLRLIYGEATFFPLMFILLLAPQFYNPLRQFGSAFHDGMNGLAAAKEIYDLIQAPEEDFAKDSLGEENLSISFKDVSFAYGDDLVVDNLSFNVAFGDQLVITGPNGAGKSTVFKLLLGLLQPSAGAIYLGKTNLAQVQPEDFYKLIGYIPQSPTLFSASVAENIALGREISPEVMEQVLTQVNLADWVATLPQGLATVVDKGMKLSSGQLRRLGLARALVTKPKILLLDEPMENLDAVNEEMIQGILAQLRGKATVMIIGHRQQTILNGDTIMYMAQGQRVFQGQQDAFQKFLKEVGHV